MTTEPELKSRIVCDADMDTVETMVFAGGEAVVFSARSPGKDKNQDAAAILPFGPRGGVLAVADGLGGQPGAEHASRLAVESLAAALDNYALAGGRMRDAILDGIEAANAAVLELGIGAGTTLAIAELSEDYVRAYNIGDSLVMSVGQRGRTKLQTIAHSPVGYALESGLLNEDEAFHHSERFYISNIVGDPAMHIDVGSPVTFSARDTVLVASDGLSDNFQVEEILEFIRKGTLTEVAQEMADRCRESMIAADGERHGKPDDLTFLLYRSANS